MRGAALVLALACSTVAQTAAATWLPSLEEIIQSSEAAFKQQIELLGHSTGKAHVEARGSSLFEHTDSLFETGNTMDVCWYTNGENLRYDTNISELTGFKPRDPKGTVRTCTNGKVSISFNCIDHRAYLSEPFHRAWNFSGFLHYFDPRLLYAADQSPPPYDAWRAMIAREQPFWLEYCELDCVPCVCVTLMRREPEDEEGNWYSFRADIWFALEQNYAIVRTKSIVEIHKGRRSSPHSESEYKANYEPSQDYPGVWVLRSSYNFHYEWMGQFNVRRMVEEQSVRFEETHFGVDVPETMFNYDALGVPMGMSINDGRFPGKECFRHDVPGMGWQAFSGRTPEESFMYHYGPGVYVGLDRIDLTAGTPRSENLPASP
jgi:hypothetical protein